MREMLNKANFFIGNFEKIFLYIILFSLITLAFGQVVLRNFFDIGYLWIDQIIKMEVLWITFLGASRASDSKGHLCIDILSYYISGSMRKFVIFSSDILLLVACIFFFYASYDSIMILQKTGISHIISGVPDWLFRVIIPYFFAITFFRAILFLINYNEADTQKQA